MSLPIQCPARLVLIVHPDPAQRALYCRYFMGDRTFSYRLLEAASGEEGYALWQQHQPDLLLLDQHLPDMEGLELIAKLQAAAPAFGLPIIFLVEPGQEAIAMQALQTGAYDYLMPSQRSSEYLILAVHRTIVATQSQTQWQQRLAQQQFIAQLLQTIQQTPILKDVLQIIVHELRQFLRTDRVLIVQFAADDPGGRITESVGPEWRSLLTVEGAEPDRSAVLNFDLMLSAADPQRDRQDEVIAIANIQDGLHDDILTSAQAEFLKTYQIQSYLALPIFYDNQRWGTLIIHHCATPRSWQPWEIEFLQELLPLVSITLRQVELYHYAQCELADRQQVEAELRKSEKRYAALAQVSPVGIFRTDAAGDCLYVNTRWCELAGLSPAQAQGKGWVNAIHPQDRVRVVAEWYQAAALDQPFASEYRFQTPTGIVSWLIGQAIAERDVAGKVIGYVCTITDITDRKRTEQALRTSEERLRVALEASRMGTWDWNIQTGLIQWSDNLESMFGLEPGTFDGSFAMFSDRLHPEDRDRVLAAIDRAVVTGEDYNIEFRILYPNGRIRWALSRGKVLYDQNGQPMRMAGNDIDITDRKQTEAALQESEEHFRQLADHIDAVFWVKEVAENRFSYISPALERLWGVQAAEILASPEAWLHYIHPDDREAVVQSFQTKVSTGQFDQEYRIVLANDRLRWVRSRCFPLQDETGYIYRLAGISEDITERKQTEATLRQSEEFKNRLLESSPDCIKVLDVEGRLLYMNAGGMCVMEIDDLTPYLHQEWLCFWGSEYRPQAEQALAAAKAGQVGIFRGFCPTAKGTPKWWEVIVSPIRGVSGQTEQVLSVSRDITERKQAEVERDRLLEQEQAARAEAERANRIKDEFLAILSHELRSPLNPILGWTKLLQTRKFDPAKTAEALATIERNVKLQTQLIDDLLDVAKILRGKLVMETAPVDLVFVIESAIETVRAAALAKSIRLHSVLPQVGRISGDSARLQQVVWNLLSNAIKFTPNQGRVDIALARVGHQAQITVSDTGKGISPHFLPHLFESFQQEDASTTRKYGGLGLGLAIVRSLVEAHGGTIEADSAGEGQGATFTVRFPLLDTELTAYPSDSLPAQDLDLSGLRILVVDDEPDARELLTMLLNLYGAEVLTVTSAAEVLMVLETFRPDVLVSDIGMPEVDGCTLIQRIRALPPERGGQIPAVALTAYAREEDYQRAIASGFQRQVTKPLDPEQLVQTLVALVGNRSR